MMNRNLKVRVFTGLMAVIVTMSASMPLAVRASELSEDENEVAEIEVFDETDEEADVETEDLEETDIFIIDQAEKDEYEDIEWEEETLEPGDEVDEVLEIMEAQEKEAEEDKRPPKHERIFGEVDGEYVEIIIHSQNNNLDTAWIDDEENEYTLTDEYNWTDRYGNIFLPDRTYVDPYYGEACFGDPVSASVKSSKKIAQSAMNSMIDCMVKINPELMLLAGPLKAIIGEAFGLESKDPNAVIVEKLDALEAQLKTMESNQKYHAEAALALSDLGGSFQNVADAIEPLKNKIGDITYQYTSGMIDETEYNRKIAALYTGSEYTDLTRALSGATNAYIGNTSFAIDQTTIFGAAYNLQCSHVMFSGEAIDQITPYLMRQLGTYLQGYALVNTVLDGYEEVVGNDAAFMSREAMLRNTGGVFDGQFDESRPGVLGQYKKFYETYDRCIFVNMSSDPAQHIKLNREITVIMGFSERMIGKGVVYSAKADEYTPDCLRKYPLNKEQMDKIIDYAACRNISIYDLLLDNVGFKLSIWPNLETQARFGMSSGMLDENATTHHLHRGTVTMKQLFATSDLTYMPYGPQVITAEWPDGLYYSNPDATNYVQAIRINKVGAGAEKVKIGDTSGKARVNAHMFFFTK